MAASDNLSGVQFQTESGLHGPVVIASHPEHGEIGYMELGPELSSGIRKVQDINVAEPHRRRGIATGMWKHAEESGLQPSHSSMRTEAGDKWARRVGNYFPPDEIV